MVKDFKKLQQLRGLSRLRQEVELAKFAHLMQAGHELEHRQAALKSEGRRASEQVPQSSVEARLQARFCALTDERLERLQAERKNLQSKIDAQRELTAGAVGRDTVLGQIAERLELEARRDQSRRN